MKQTADTTIPATSSFAGPSKPILSEAIRLATFGCPVWTGGVRLELDLPSVELFCQFIPVPGMGFAIPLSKLRSPDDGDHVVMQPKIGFGVMGLGLLRVKDTEVDGICP